MERQFTFPVGGIEVDVTVNYDWIKEIRGAREGGLQLEPDEPAHAEINSIAVFTRDDSRTLETANGPVTYAIDRIGRIPPRTQLLIPDWLDQVIRDYINDYVDLAPEPPYDD